MMRKKVFICMAFLCTIALWGKVHDVTAFGAAPDDDKDDAESIQAAINEAETKGGAVYIPSGRYLIGKSLKINRSGLKIYGDGMSSVLTADGCETAIIASYTCDRKPAQSLDNVMLSDLMLDGKDGKVDGVAFVGVTRGSKISNLFIRNCRNGIMLLSCWSLTVENNNINNCTDAGLSFGLKLEEYTVYTGTVVNALLLNGNTVRGCGTGLLWASGNGWSMNANTLELNRLNARFVNVECGSITGNYFEASKEDPAQIILGDKSKGIAKNLFIAGNMFYQNAANSEKYKAGKDYAMELRGAIGCEVGANRYATSSRPIVITGHRSRVFNNRILHAAKPEQDYGVEGMYHQGTTGFWLFQNGTWTNLKTEASQ